MNLKEVQELSYNNLSIKVAEICGWTNFKVIEARSLDEADYTVAYPPWIQVLELKRICFPMYSNDLNAMHEAEKCIKDDDMWLNYERLLVQHGDNHGYSATARQRAEVFILTMKENKNE